MKKDVKYVLAVLLALVIVASLAVSSVVTARPLADTMDYHFITIPGGSTHSSYNGDYVSGDRTIYLTNGWSTNLPYNTCAVAVRLAYKDNVSGHYAILKPAAGGAPVQSIIQAANQWNNNTGIVPITGSTAKMYLDINSPGYVYIEISGYWLCNDYVRPTLAP